MSAADVILTLVWTFAFGLTMLTMRRARKQLREAGEIHAKAMAEFRRWQEALADLNRQRAEDEAPFRDMSDVL